MRATLPLLLLFLVPTASAATVWIEAPAEASAGLPFEASVCVAAPPGERVEVRAWLTNGTLWAEGVRLRPSRYDLALDAGAEGVACRALAAQPGMDASASLHARLRDAHEARDEVTLREVAPPPLRLVEAWGVPFEGVRLRNAGDAPLELARFRLDLAGRTAGLPNVTLTPGEEVFVGLRAPPGLPHAALEVALRNGTTRVMLHELPVAALATPSLRDGHLVDANGTRRMGVERAPAEPMRVEGKLVVYATPDAGVAPVLALLDGARDEILLEGFTLTSADVAAALVRALDRGVRVRMLLEGAPAGGIAEEERAILALLATRGAEVALMRSAEDFPTRFATQHAKVIVVDRSAALVATENLHAGSYPSLAGGGSTRGYGAIVWNATLARRFAATLEADMAPWPDVQRVDPEALPPPADATGSALVEGGETLTIAAFAGDVGLVLSPDDPLALARALGQARRSVDAQLLFAHARFGDASNPFLDALVDAARHNVSVRVLLDGRFDDGRNREVVAMLEAVAAREGLPIAARVDSPSRLLHAKMVVLDEERAYVGSMNWGRASAFDNREAGLIIDSREVGAWLTLAFEKDWNKEGEPPGEAREVVAPALAAALLAIVLTATLRPRPPLRRRGRGGGRTRR